MQEPVLTQQGGSGRQWGFSMCLVFFFEKNISSQSRWGDFPFPLAKSLLGNKGDTDLQHPQILDRDMSFGIFYHCLQPSLKLLSNDLGPGRSLVPTDSWANGYKHLGARYLLPASVATLLGTIEFVCRGGLQEENTLWGYPDPLLRALQDVALYSPLC